MVIGCHLVVIFSHLVVIFSHLRVIELHGSKMTREAQMT